MRQSIGNTLRLQMDYIRKLIVDARQILHTRVTDQVCGPCVEHSVPWHVYASYGRTITFELNVYRY